MTEPIVSFLVKIATVHIAFGIVIAILFFTRWLKTMDPAATGSSWGFKVLVTPGVVALWPLILMKVFHHKSLPDADGAEKLRRTHRTAIIVLMIFVSLIFTAALVWRAPALVSLPEIKLPTP